MVILNLMKHSGMAGRAANLTVLRIVVEDILSLSSLIVIYGQEVEDCTLVRPHLECRMQFWSRYSRKDVMKLQSVQ